MKFCINNLLLSISFALDLAEKDFMIDSKNHSKRVAIVSGKIGRQLGLSDEEIFDLVSYALLHDVGIVKLNSEAHIESHEKTGAHCIFGEEIVKDFPFLEKRENIVLYHHETYNGEGTFGKFDHEIHLFSKIIGFSDYFELLHREHLSQEEIVRDITNNIGIKFSPEIANAWLELQKTASFWLDIDDLFIDNVKGDLFPKICRDVDYRQIHETTKIFSPIVDSYSSFTGNHSSGISEKIDIMADFYQFDQEKKYKLLISADMHDIGKLGIPNRILDKNGKLTNEEFSIVKKHTYYTRRILEKIEYFGDIVEWASNHHEKLNGTGYPYGLGAEKIDFCSRLMAVIDIYQALTENRPYRCGMNHVKAMDILMEMVEKNEIDGQVVADVDKVFGGVLVENTSK
ncbi:MAG: hypothetical protein K0R71_932 [Bacillales bacterium]|jgi:HD-GYP domain-containing protein (c-di-GMP phosphodiesterase class II)|nr:hypothetical protein [Bacillales bacterium]